MADDKINELSGKLDEELGEKNAKAQNKLLEERIALGEKLKLLKEDSIEHDNTLLEIEDKMHQASKVILENRVKDLELKKQLRKLTEEELVVLNETKDQIEEIDDSYAKRKKAQENINNLREKERVTTERIKRDVLGVVKAEESRLSGLKKILEVASKVTPEEAFFTMAAKLEEYSAAILAVATAYDEVAAKVRQATNTSGQYDNTIANVTEANREFGISMDDVGGSIIALRENFGQFSNMSQETSDDLTLFTTKMQKAGISADTTARFMTTASKSFGMGVEQTKKYQLELFGFAKANGISTKVIADGLNSVMPRLAAFGKEGPRIFKDLAFASKNLGIEMGKLLDITEQFTTFEGAAEAAGNLNAVLGGNYIDTLELLKAANEDPMKAMDMLRGTLEKTGKSFDQLDNQTKRMFADIMKQDLDTTSKMFSKTSEEAKKAAMTEEQFNKSLESFVPLGEKMKQLVAALTPVFQTLASVLGTVITVFTKIATSPFGRFILTIIGVLGILLGAVTVIAVGIVTLASQIMLLGKAFSFITPFFGGMRAGISSITSSISSSLPNIGRAVSSFVSNMGTSINTLASSIGSGLSRIVSGISGSLSSLATAVGRGLTTLLRGVGSALTAFGKSVAGASPEIGIAILLLIGLGVAALLLGYATKLVVDSLTDMMEVLMQNPKAALIASGSFLLLSAGIALLSWSLAMLTPIAIFALPVLYLLKLMFEDMIDPLVKLGASFKEVGVGSKALMSLIADGTYEKFQNLKNVLTLIAEEMAKISKYSLSFESILSSPFMVAMALATPKMSNSGETTSINNNTMTTNTTKIENASSSTPLKIEVPVKLNEKVIASIAEEVYVTTNKNGGITLGRPKVNKTSEAVG